MKCRKSVTALKAAGEHGTFVQAVIDLKKITTPSIIPAAQMTGATSRYDDYVWLHLAAFGLIHLGPAFGPWHREILRQFELDLRDVSGNPDISVPYWDWPTGREPADTEWPFTADLMGGLGTGAATAVVTGAFAGSTGDWPINVRDPGDTHTVLRRVSATNPGSASLPNAPTTQTSLAANTYDSTPFNDNGFPTNAEAAASFRKSLEFFLHNGPHNFVGNDNGTFLDMMRAASPNDPIFFLHHSQVDRMWSVWQDKNPGVNHFEPLSGAAAGHNLNDIIDLLDPTFFNHPVLATNAAHVDLHSSGVWYDSDLPEITVATPSVDFGDVPAGLTTYAPAQFSVEGCRAFSLHITGVAGADFSIPPGNAVVNVPATDDPSPRTISVFLRCLAPADGSPIGNGSVTIEARTLDDEGHFLDPAGQQHTFDSFSATLLASNIGRPTTAVAFVSDRSGSMNGNAGAGFTKFELLEEALESATDLLDTDDSAALVFFDESTMTPLPIGPVGGGGGIAAALADPAIQPDFGSTAIGLGLIEGAGELDVYTPPAGVTDPNLAIVCLTDGNENSGPSVTSAAVGNALSAYSNDVYAVGFGTVDNVSAPTLGSISNYMLITGDNSADVRRFMLTKYFVQIIADVKRSQIVVDPDGVLHAGVKHEIPFDLSEADVEAEIVVLTQAARFLDAAVETPGGDVLPLGALGPNGSVDINRNNLIIRLRLPAVPTSPATSHAGRWKLHIALSKRSLGATREHLVAMGATGKRPAVDYSVIVLSRSNLEFEVARTFPVIRPGDSMPISAWLRQYGQPVTTAKVTAQVSAPNGQMTEYRLAPDGHGGFAAEISTATRGVYRCRIMAHGHTLGGVRFTRETTRTFGVGDPMPPKPAGSPADADTKWCELLACLLEQESVRRTLKRAEINAEELYECLRRICGEQTRESVRKVTPGSVAGPGPVSRDELMHLVRLASAAADRADPLAVPEPEPFSVAEIDQKFFDSPMFMPVLAWNDKGEVVFADTGKSVPARRDRSFEIAKLPGVSEEQAKRLHEAGIATSGELLERAVDLRDILGISKMQARDLLMKARAVDAPEPAKKAATKRTAAKKATSKKTASKKAASKKSAPKETD